MRRSTSILLGRLALLVSTIIAAGCDDDEPPAPSIITCADVPGSAADITTEEGLRTLLADVQSIMVPELDGVMVGLDTQNDDTAYFVANLDFGTLTAPPLERHYLVRYNPRLFDDPPPFDAVVAILVHELKHILDYTTMDTQTFIDFGVELLSGDPSAYERATDEFALERGCADGLSAYRVWIYAQLETEEAVAEKRRNYYTPEEIDAWLTTHTPAGAPR